MTFVEVVGYTAAGLGILMFAMQTMIPLRVTGLAHNVGQIAFGLMAGIWPTVLQHVILLPLNGYRLFEMLRLVKKVENANAGDPSVEWFKPFMTRRSVKAGDVLFRKGDEGDRMYHVVSGALLVQELNIRVEPNTTVGELAMLAPSRKRTQSVVCLEDAELLEMSYSRIEQLYYQNPTFGFYFLRLSSARLFDNIERLEAQIAVREIEIAKLRGAPALEKSMSA
jgi:CRP/FNR family cyclic AMP-dependent transcriptional regulator